VKGAAVAEEEEYWKKPEPSEQKTEERKTSTWSKSRAIRIIIWIIVLLAIIPISLVISAYLSGFDSVFEMLGWIRNTISG
jgi:preprotein translocase subunit Sec63